MNWMVWMMLGGPIAVACIAVSMTRGTYGGSWMHKRVNLFCTTMVVLGPLGLAVLADAMIRAPRQ